MAPIPRSFVRLAAAVILAVLVGACGDDESGLGGDPFAPEAAVGFDSYVALGNSITAGFQSGGMNDSTQSLAYPVRLARVFGAPAFEIPALARPGCPPPLASLVPPAYVGGAAPGTCAGPAAGATPPFHNLAVPGYKTADLLARPAGNPLQDFILPPGQSAVEAMQALNPTFVTLWVGSNDVLGAALAGFPPAATSFDAFTTAFEAVLDSIAATGAEAAVANVPDVTALPALLPAPRLSGLVDTLQSLGLTNLTVSNCDDKSGWLVSASIVAPAFEGDTVAIDCDNTNPAAPDGILTAAEVSTLQVTVDAYNGFIASEVAARSFALVDVHDFFVRAATLFGPSELTIELDPVVAVHFGAFFSLDGVHPSSFAHRVLANVFIDAINEAYDLPVFVPTGLRVSR